MEISRLGPGDAPRLAALMELFADAFDEPGTYRGRPPGRDHAERLLGAAHVIVLVALDGDAEIGDEKIGDEEIVGGLVAYDLPKPEQARSEVYIYDLAVAAPHRRRGVATALIEALKPIAAARGAWVIFVQADPFDAPAVALYQKLGVREEVFHFDIPVT